MQTPPLSHSARLAAGLAALTALYLGLAGRLAATEIFAAVLAAAAALGSARLLRGPLRCDEPLLRLTAEVLWQSLKDCLVVSRELATALLTGLPRSEFRASDAEPRPTAASVIGHSITPNSYIVEERRPLAHVFAPPEGRTR